MHYHRLNRHRNACMSAKSFTTSTVGYYGSGTFEISRTITTCLLYCWFDKECSSFAYTYREGTPSVCSLGIGLSVCLSIPAVSVRPSSRAKNCKPSNFPCNSIRFSSAEQVFQWCRSHLVGQLRKDIINNRKCATAIWQYYTVFAGQRSQRYNRR